ncbi:hypothetical protein Hanom_Chr01g00049731 [Helianthus anomalus]
MYSTRPLISHLGKACLPINTVFLISVAFGGSSKFPFGKNPEKKRLKQQTLTFSKKM